MPVLLYEPKKIYYHSSFLSCSSVACLLTLILILVLSYLMIYYSGEVFIENILEIKQPNVKFNEQYLLNIFEENTLRSYSSILKFNDYEQNLLPVPLVKVIYLFRLDKWT